MGAGAGYTIETSDIAINGKPKLLSYDIKQNGHWQTVDVECEVPITGDVRASSYMFGCPWIKEVNMVVTAITINFYENEEVSDQTILDVLSNTSNYYGEGVYGGGWSHSTFDGVWEINSFSELDYANDISSVTIQIPDKFIVNYIDKAVTGDNVIYDVVFNGDVIESYGLDEEDQAIQVLKDEINKAIAEGGPESVDFSDCYVEQGYDILLNGIGESDVDFDYSTLVYNADGDPYYEDYI